MNYKLEVNNVDLDKQILHEQCGKCSRKLKDTKSRERGFGPVCHKKYLAEKAKAEYERNQQQLPM